MREIVSVRILVATAVVVVLFAVVACAAQPAATSTTIPTVVPTKPAVAAPAATTSSLPGASSADIESGKTVFTNNCNGCHPNGGKGAGPDIKGKSPDLVKAKVRSGGNGMPAFAADRLSDIQLNQVAAYVNSLK